MDAPEAIREIDIRIGRLLVLEDELTELLDKEEATRGRTQDN